MENQKKRGVGRPIKYLTQEEKKEAVKQQKTKYMLNKEWYCDVCKNGLNYTMAGKWCHLNTNKHRRNTNIINLREKLNNIMQRRQV